MHAGPRLALFLAGVLPACFHPSGKILDIAESETTTEVDSLSDSGYPTNPTTTVGSTDTITSPVTTCGETSCTGEASTSSGACDQQCTTSGTASTSTSADPGSTSSSGRTSASDGSSSSGDGCVDGCRTLRRIFVTSSTYAGDFGGIAGADALCNQSAVVLEPPGNFKAWLSDQTSSPWDRFDIAFSEVYQRLDGVQVVIGGWPDLTDGAIAKAISVDEFGAQVQVSTYAWTSTEIDGSELMPTCDDWTNSQSGVFGIVGSVIATDSTWTSADLLPCSAKMRLYCVEDP